MHDSDYDSAHDIAPREPDSRVIAEIGRDHLTEFLERASGNTRSPDHRVLRFVQRELNALSECGELFDGFLRL